MTDPYPYVDQIRDEPTQETTRLLWERLAELQALFKGLKTTVDVGGAPIINVAAPQKPGDAVTNEYAHTNYLSAGSSPSLLLDFFKSALGSLIPWILKNQLDSKATNEQKILMAAGTLSPDQKPTGLTTDQTGVLFHSTDFDRWYRWTGTGWLEVGGAPKRYQIKFWVYDPASRAVPTGWSQVGLNTSYNISTDTGTVFSDTLFSSGGSGWADRLLTVSHSADFGTSAGTFGHATNAGTVSSSQVVYVKGSPVPIVLPSVGHSHTLTVGYPQSYQVIPIVRL